MGDGSSYGRISADAGTKSIVGGAILVKNNLANKLKQVPEGYLIVGIDPHQKKHTAVAMTQDFTTRCKFKFNNSREGYDMALERLRDEMIRSGCKGVMFAVETGGHYWRNLAYFLDERGLPFRFINQFSLKRRREGKDLNRRKNDYRDSEVAAQLLCTGEFTESKLKHGVYAELHAAHNSYRRMVRERTRISNLIRGLPDGLFPAGSFHPPQSLQCRKVDDEAVEPASPEPCMAYGPNISP